VGSIGGDDVLAYKKANHERAGGGGKPQWVNV